VIGMPVSILKPEHVWTHESRTLTSHAYPFTNPPSAVNLSNLQVAGYLKVLRINPYIYQAFVTYTDPGTAAKEIIFTIYQIPFSTLNAKALRLHTTYIEGNEAGTKTFELYNRDTAASITSVTWSGTGRQVIATPWATPPSIDTWLSARFYASSSTEDISICSNNFFYEVACE